MLIYELPLDEMVFDFYDRRKRISRGYASMDYDILGFEPGDLVKMSILVNAERVDALAMIVHRARRGARWVMCEKLKKQISLTYSRFRSRRRWVAASSRARPSGRQERRDGQMLRRRHLAQTQTARKQKKGKKRMRQFGQVEIPQEAFIAALKMDEN